MDLMKLQNLLNECIMIEQGNYLGGNFSIDLAEAQLELDQAKKLLIPDVSSSNNVDYKQAFELALKYINSKPLKVDTTIKELNAWDNLTDFIDKHNLY